VVRAEEAVDKGRKIGRKRRGGREYEEDHVLCWTNKVNIFLEL
jgi:hypothetical protein